MDDTAITRMSPERFRGVSGPEDDVFAWGALIAYAPTGEPSFRMGEAEVMIYRVLSEEPRLGEVPPELAPAVRAAMAKEPSERPTAEQLVRMAAADSGPDDSATLIATMVERHSAPQPEPRSSAPSPTPPPDGAPSDHPLPLRPSAARARSPWPWSSA